MRNLLPRHSFVRTLSALLLTPRLPFRRWLNFFAAALKVRLFSSAPSQPCPTLAQLMTRCLPWLTPSQAVNCRRTTGPLCALPFDNLLCGYAMIAESGKSFQFSARSILVFYRFVPPVASVAGGEYCKLNCLIRGASVRYTSALSAHVPRALRWGRPTRLANIGWAESVDVANARCGDITSQSSGNRSQVGQ